MAARRATIRPSEEAPLYELGKQGRKTGVKLRETTARDEHGMEPVDGIFSSPQKPDATPTQGDIAMELDSSSGPGPATLRANNRTVVPHGRSPMKTYLKSPAVRNPHLGRQSSPVRGNVVEEDSSRDATVTRRLDFNGALLNGRGVNGHRPNGVSRPAHDDDDEDDDEDAVLGGHKHDKSAMTNGHDSSMAIIDNDVYDHPEDDTEEELDAVKSPPAKQAGKSKRGRSAKASKNIAVEEVEELVMDEQPVSRRGRPGKNKAGKHAEEPRSSKKRGPGRISGGRSNDAEEEIEEEPRVAKRQRTEHKTSSSKTLTAKTHRRSPTDEEREEADEDVAPRAKVPKAKARKRRSSLPLETPTPDIPHGPPLPKNRGLVLQRQGVNGTTRSGRTSTKPLAWWRGDRIQYEETVEEDIVTKQRFLVPTIKEVIRANEEELESRTRSRPRGRQNKSGKIAAAARGGASRAASAPVAEEEEDLEDWEVEGGLVEGEVYEWLPQHNYEPPAPDEEVPANVDRIAISAAAVDTREIRDAQFKFAKTLTLPFFGTGIVDLPPGAVKKPKNTRRMHMAFFVFTGKVNVTVHETEFRISTGGMWFVPRGNFYSIENDCDTTARLWFAQACEVPVGIEELGVEPPQANE